MKKFVVASLSLVAVTSWSIALLMITNVHDSASAQKKLPVQQTASIQASTTATEWSSRINESTSSPTRHIPFATIQTTIPQVLGITAYRTDQLTTEQTLDLIKPGVISLIDNLKGTLTIPDYDIDLHTFALTPRPDLKAYTSPVDDVVFGSGFIINPDGHAITNAHVISKSYAYSQFKKDLKTHWKDVFKYEVGQLNDKDYAAYNQMLTNLYGNDLSTEQKILKAADVQIDAYVKVNAHDTIQQKIVVVDKSLKGATLNKDKQLAQVFSEGLPVTVDNFDPNYETSGVDIALIQVSGYNVPALPLGDSNTLDSGTKVFVLGYPYNAHIDESDLFEPTLTEGIVSSVKQYKGHTLFQLDNKASEGSSGGPLTDAHGNVVGVLTYMSGSSTSGDEFAYALPIELAKDVLNKNNVPNDLGVYGSNLLLGLAYKDQASCKKAVDYFTAAEQADTHFNPQDYLTKYIDPCKTLIAVGLSKDSSWNIIVVFYKNHATNASILTVFIATILFFGIWLLAHFITHLRSQERILPSVPSPQMKLQ